MERHVNMAEISDGKRYKSTDMARIGCNECEGCSDCCREVGSSIVLDPWDVYMLEKNLSCRRLFQAVEAAQERTLA